MSKAKIKAQKLPAAPVAVTRQSVVPCGQCGEPIRYAAGTGSQVLTEHYNRRHLSELAGPLSH